MPSKLGQVQQQHQNPKQKCDGSRSKIKASAQEIRYFKGRSKSIIIFYCQESVSPITISTDFGGIDLMDQAETGRQASA